MTEAERREFIKRMDARRLETPFLRITEKCAVEGGKVYVATGIMAKDKVRFDVRTAGGELVFAEAEHAGRAQEYAPAALVNEQATKHVLLEYDIAEIGSEWPRLVSSELACQTGGLSVSWVSPGYADSAEETILASKETPVEHINGRDCRHFRHVVDGDEGHGRMAWEYWIDCADFDTVRYIRPGGRRYDYTIEHLKSDEGLKWELDVSQFKNEPEPKLTETPFKSGRPPCPACRSRHTR